MTIHTIPFNSAERSRRHAALFNKALKVSALPGQP